MVATSLHNTDRSTLEDIVGSWVTSLTMLLAWEGQPGQLSTKGNHNHMSIQTPNTSVPYNSLQA